jgi:alpha-amylase
MRIGIRAATLAALGALGFAACRPLAPGPGVPAPVPDLATAAAAAGDPALFWNAATVYFLLTDRFANGDPSNDFALGRARDGAVLRSFEGGDLAGLLAKLREGWFDSLGVRAIWMTPFVEQVRGSVDEGTGRTYGFHGYWTRDWTAVDPALGTGEDLRAVVEEAHRRGIRVLMDAVINHTGPVTPLDPVWPEGWVRTGPRCRYEDYESTVDCTLVANLPDLRTDSDEPVELPPPLLEKWRREGRLERETAELDAFFARTGYPRAPRYYVIKWLTDWVRELGIDGYRVDTAKHFEESIAPELRREAERALADWREASPYRLPGDLPFFMLGEVYNWELGHGRAFEFGDRSVDFFAHGYDALIDFGFKRALAGGSLESLDDVYSRYAAALGDGALDGFAILNYASSHDDGSPLDPDREEPLRTGTRLLLAPGGAQIYYGDELARPLRVDGAAGDANLRSFMNWEDLEDGAGTPAVLEHWRRLGRFRAAHPAVGAGAHLRLRAEPYVFARTLESSGLSDRVVVALDAGEGRVEIPVGGVFPDGTELVDAWSGRSGTVANGAVRLETESGLVLLAERR